MVHISVFIFQFHMKQFSINRMFLLSPFCNKTSCSCSKRKSFAIGYAVFKKSLVNSLSINVVLALTKVFHSFKSLS
jgi:hypothetical protein